MDATPEDVRYAYRLLLGREPDADGLMHHTDLVRRSSVNPIDLARMFMMSDEYSARDSTSSMLREVEIDGVTLFPWRGDTLIGDHISPDSAYEPNVLPLFLEYLSPGDHVADIGANVGMFSLLAARRVGREGRVYSVEPVGKNVRSLCAGILRNGFENVSLFPLAASDKASVIGVIRRSDSSNGIVDSNVKDMDAVDFVPTQRLDFLLAAIEGLDVVKIDIEGHEPIAWKGLKPVIEKFRPLIFSEFSPLAIRNHSRVAEVSYLEDLFEVASEPIEVLARDGRRIQCSSPEEVMNEWRGANRRANLSGELHLDLLIHAGKR